MRSVKSQDSVLPKVTMNHGPQVCLTPELCPDLQQDATDPLVLCASRVCKEDPKNNDVGNSAPREWYSYTFPPRPLTLSHCPFLLSFFPLFLLLHLQEPSAVEIIKLLNNSPSSVDELKTKALI